MRWTNCGRCHLLLANVVVVVTISGCFFHFFLNVLIAYRVVNRENMADLSLWSFVYVFLNP